MDTARYCMVEMKSDDPNYSQVWYVFRVIQKVNVVVKPRGQHYWRLLGAGSSAQFDTLEAAFDSAALYDAQNTEATRR